MKYKLNDKINDLTVTFIKLVSGHNLYLFKCKCGKDISFYESELPKKNCGQCHIKVVFHKTVGRPEMKDDDYKIWRKKVFARHGYKCAICKVDKKLEAHHKNGWSWCIAERYNVNNGVCLCKFHHNEFHNIYGRGKNTEYQWRMYYTSKGF